MRKFDFTLYDSLFREASIAHNSSDPKLIELYYEVKRVLTVDLAFKK